RCGSPRGLGTPRRFLVGLDEPGAKLRILGVLGLEATDLRAELLEARRSGSGRRRCRREIPGEARTWSERVDGRRRLWRRLGARLGSCRLGARRRLAIALRRGGTVRGQVDLARLLLWQGDREADQGFVKPTGENDRKNDRAKEESCGPQGELPVAMVDAHGIRSGPPGIDGRSRRRLERAASRGRAGPRRANGARVWSAVSRRAMRNLWPPLQGSSPHAQCARPSSL